MTFSPPWNFYSYLVEYFNHIVYYVVFFFLAWYGQTRCFQMQCLHDDCIMLYYYL